jgi:hypothetical protein
MDASVGKTSMPTTVMGPNYSYVFDFERDFTHEITKGWFLVSIIFVTMMHDVGYYFYCYVIATAATWDGLLPCMHVEAENSWSFLARCTFL